eukprot:scaffold1655_cov94-Isochrysis_galbana.AAC.1
MPGLIPPFAPVAQVETLTSVRLDESTDQKIQINFNVTLHMLPCRFASVDIADIMGTHLQNVSTNLIKTRISAAGVPIGKAAPKPRVVSHAVARTENAPKVRSRCIRPPPPLRHRCALLLRACQTRQVPLELRRPCDQNRLPPAPTPAHRTHRRPGPPPASTRTCQSPHAPYNFQPIGAQYCHAPLPHLSHPHFTHQPPHTPDPSPPRTREAGHRTQRCAAPAARRQPVLFPASLTQPPPSPPQVSPELDEEDLHGAVTDHKLVLVNFYAPWCPWSRRLQPVRGARRLWGGGEKEDGSGGIG